MSPLLSAGINPVSTLLLCHLLYLNTRAVYQIQMSRESRTEASLKYTVYPLKITEHDSHDMQLNSSFIPKPQVLHNSSFSFKLPMGHQILYALE